jgi:hypothetical protein
MGCHSIRTTLITKYLSSLTSVGNIGYFLWEKIKSFNDELNERTLSRACISRYYRVRFVIMIAFYGYP